MDKLSLYQVIFVDGTVFNGGKSHFLTLWDEIPQKTIKRIFYKLPDNNYICLGGYEKYFHMIEATKDWMRMGGKKGMERLSNEPRIEYAYVMGKKGNTVTSYRITLFHKKDDRYKIGDIVRRDFDINSKFIKGLNPTIWK